MPDDLGSLRAPATLLDDVASRNPVAAAAAQAAAVDRVLGRRGDRAARLPKPSSGGGSRPSKPDERGSCAFDWFQSIAARLPAVMSSEEVARAAVEVEVGLAAENALLVGTGRLVRADAERGELEALAVAGRMALEELVSSNLRLVFYWSKGTASSVDEVQAQDAFQAGCVGLIRGLQGWDAKRGAALSTYVTWHIRAAIQRWRRNELLLIRVPVHALEAMESGQEIASPELMALVERARNVVFMPDVDEEDFDALSLVESDADLWQIEERLDCERAARTALSVLSPREALVLRARNGWVGGEPMTLEEIGARLGVTRERVRQIEAKALKKVRRELGAA